MPTFLVSQYVEAGRCDKTGKEDIEVFLVSCEDLGFRDKWFSKNAFRDDVKLFCAAARQLNAAGDTRMAKPSSRIQFSVTGYEVSAVCDKTRKAGDCYIVSCPQLGYKNRPLSRNAVRDEVRFHGSGEITDGDNVLEMHDGDLEILEAG